MKLGITGTREGCTPAQEEELNRRLLERDEIEELHHGCCIGVDSQADDYANMYRIRTVLHPPTDPKHRDECWSAITRPEKPYLNRNRDIVDETDALLAFPKKAEKLGGGTWYTVWYAVKAGKPVTIVYSDGRLEER